MVGADGAVVSAESGAPILTRPLPFTKLTGSGNDFVFVDARTDAALEAVAMDPAAIAAACDRRFGVGADGVVVLRPDPVHPFRIRYFNADGTQANLCGNATLCTVRLATHLGIADPAGFTFESDAGELRGWLRPDGQPEVDLNPFDRLEHSVGIPLAPGERRMGFGFPTVPHLVVEVDDLDAVDVAARGPVLRHEPSFERGTNVNWVAQTPAGWAMRTFERGVEGETLACASGATTCAAVLRAWGVTGDETRFRTRSGRTLTIRYRQTPQGEVPSISGEGRIVFMGTLVDLGVGSG